MPTPHDHAAASLIVKMLKIKKAKRAADQLKAREILGALRDQSHDLYVEELLPLHRVHPKLTRKEALSPSQRQSLKELEDEWLRMNDLKEELKLQIAFIKPFNFSLFQTN